MSSHTLSWLQLDSHVACIKLEPGTAGPAVEEAGRWGCALGLLI